MSRRKKQIDNTTNTSNIFFKPKTINQSKYIKIVEENDISLVAGPAGTGKTFIACGMALKYLFEGKVKGIILTRPMVQCGEGLGFLKGSLSEKVDPYMTPLLEELYGLSSRSIIDKLIEDKIIRIIPLELMRGQNFKDVFVIADEAENIDFGQFKMFLTRFVDGSKIIVSGDFDQTDLNICDYKYIINRLENIKGIGIAKLEYEDIVRSDLVGRILKAL